MSEEAIAEATTKTKLILCDETIDVEARVDSREEACALIARIAHLSDFLWPREDEAEEQAEEEARAEPVVSCETVTGAAVVQDAPPHVLADAIRVIDEPQNDALDCLTDEERATVTFGERQLLTPKQIEAVALKRSGYDLAAAAARMGLKSANNVSYHLSIARQKGVNP